MTCTTFELILRHTRQIQDGRLWRRQQLVSKLMPFCTIFHDIKIYKALQKCLLTFIFQSYVKFIVEHILTIMLLSSKISFHTHPIFTFQVFLWIFLWSGDFWVRLMRKKSSNLSLFYPLITCCIWWFSSQSSKTGFPWSVNRQWNQVNGVRIAICMTAILSRRREPC